MRANIEDRITKYRDSDRLPPPPLGNAIQTVQNIVVFRFEPQSKNTETKTHSANKNKLIRKNVF